MRTATLLVAIAALLTFASPAAAFTITGGTPEQQATVTATIQSCAADYRWTESHVGDVAIRFGSDLGVPGSAWFGSIYLDASLVSPMLETVVAHEWSHQIYRTLPAPFRRWWVERVASGKEPFPAWTEQPGEIWAESMRLALWPGWFEGRDDMTIVSASECRAVISLWRWIDSLWGV